MRHRHKAPGPSEFAESSLCVPVREESSKMTADHAVSRKVTGLNNAQLMDGETAAHVGV